MKNTLALLSTILFIVLVSYSSNFEGSVFYPFIKGVLSMSVVFLFFGGFKLFYDQIFKD